MSPFICLTWPSADQASALQVDRLEVDLLQGGGWRVERGAPGVRVYNLEDRRLVVQSTAQGRVMVIGDLFDHAGRLAGVADDIPDDALERRAARIVETGWGRYMVVWRDSDGAFRGALRAPCGVGDAAVWRAGAITVVATAAPQALLGRLGPGCGLDWGALHRLAADPFFGVPDSPFAGVTGLPSGALALARAGALELRHIWTPARFAREPVRNDEPAATRLRDAVDLSVRALAEGGEPILAEVSGGFDSAVVAASLRRCDAPVAGWCNHFTQDRSGDERVYAEAVGRALSVDVMLRARPPAEVTPAALARSQFGLRPSVFALDAVYDAETLAVAEMFGAKRLFTGFGGDGLFYSIPNPAIAADLLRHQGLGGLLGGVGDLARWTRKSVWSVARSAFCPPPPTRAMPSAPWVAPLPPEARPPRHPWLEGLEGLSAPKRNHVEEQVLALIAGGTSLRGQALDVVHPLFSQPVLELCLRLPVDRLVEGGRDRALARRAFAERIPTVLHRRRSKGEMGLYYGQALAERLAALREFLLSGRLVERGILLKAPLETVTQEAWLSQHGSFSALLFTAAIEAWVQRWEPISRMRQA